MKIVAAVLGGAVAGGALATCILGMLAIRTVRHFVKSMGVK